MDTIHLRFFKFFQQGQKSGERHYLLPKEVWERPTDKQEVYLEGIGGDGRSYGTGYQVPIRVQRIDMNPDTGFYEVDLDHPWWSRAICEKPDYPMGTGVKPVELDIHSVSMNHMQHYGC